MEASVRLAAKPVAACPFTHLKIAAAVLAAALMSGTLYPDAARAQSVPTVDIAATCRAASIVTVSLLGSTGTNDFQVCMDGEKRARDTIIKGLVGICRVRPRGLHPDERVPANLCGMAHLHRNE
jgi:hypothetical protein